MSDTEMCVNPVCKVQTDSGKEFLQELNVINDNDTIIAVMFDAMITLPNVYPKLSVEERTEFAAIFTTRKNWSQKATQVLAKYDGFKDITDKDWHQWKTAKQYQQQHDCLSKYFTSINEMFKKNAPAAKKISVTAQLESTKQELAIVRQAHDSLLERIAYYEDNGIKALEQEIARLKKELTNRDDVIASKDNAIQSLREEMCQLRSADV